MNVWAVEPFYGGSHRAFLDAVVDRSRHRWTLLTGKPVHWKWRMRSAPLQLAEQASRLLATGESPDVVFCTDMLDLPSWRGLVRDARIDRAATVVYFHESQWSYPVAPDARADAHYGYTNLLTALAADHCWFNSAYHRDDFLAHSEAFVHRMPDSAAAHRFDRLRRICSVMQPGFEPPTQASERRVQQGTLTIGWVSRWEHDKRPDRLVRLLHLLQDRQVEFQLILLGPRPTRDTAVRDQILNEFGSRIRYFGFAANKEEYWRQLAKMDVVVSCADHEFFGIAICEAIWAGACPVLPNRLSYPELVPPDCLYDSLQHAAEKIASFRGAAIREAMQRRCRQQISELRIEKIVKRVDEKLQTSPPSRLREGRTR